MQACHISNRYLKVLAALALLIGCMIFLAPLTLGIPLTDPDEGLHASIAQEMVERGDWVTPRFQGKAFLDKPILFTWTQALSLKLFGMTAEAARLPGLLFGFLAMIVVGVVGWRIYGAAAGILAAMLYATTVLPTIMANLPVHDAALVPVASLAILLFWEADRAAGLRAKASLTTAIGVLLGVSCLTKGLVGIGLVGVAYGTFLLATGRLTRGACLRGAAALAIAGLTALPWYLAMESRNPGYLHYYFVERHLLGFATESQRHAGEPWWYYLPILLTGGLPWVLYLPLAIRDWWEHRKTSPVAADHGGTALLWCWIIGCTVLFSVAGSKLVTYIWPVFPPMAVLAGSVWAKLLEGSLSAANTNWFKWNFVPIGWFGPLLLPGGMVVLHYVDAFPLPWHVLAAAVLVGFSAWIPSFLWNQRRLAPALAAGVMVPAVHMLAFLAFIAPHLTARYSARDLAEYFNRLGQVPERTVVVEERLGSVVFFLKPEIRRGLKPGQLGGKRARTLLHTDGPKPGTVYAVDCSCEGRLGAWMRHRPVESRQAGRYWIYQVRPSIGSTQASVASLPGETSRR